MDRPIEEAIEAFVKSFHAVHRSEIEQSLRELLANVVRQRDAERKEIADELKSSLERHVRAQITKAVSVATLAVGLLAAAGISSQDLLSSVGRRLVPTTVISENLKSVPLSSFTTLHGDLKSEVPDIVVDYLEHAPTEELAGIARNSALIDGIWTWMEDATYRRVIHTFGGIPGDATFKATPDFVRKHATVQHAIVQGIAPEYHGGRTPCGRPLDNAKPQAIVVLPADLDRHRLIWIGCGPGYPRVMRFNIRTAEGAVRSVELVGVEHSGIGAELIVRLTDTALEMVVGSPFDRATNIAGTFELEFVSDMP